MAIFPLIAHELAAELSRQHGFSERDAAADDLGRPTRPPDGLKKG